MKNGFSLKLKNFTRKKPIFCGIISAVILYVITYFGNGISPFGDIVEMNHRLKYFCVVSPVLFVIYIFAVAYFAKKNRIKSFFLASYFTLLMPFVSAIFLWLGVEFAMVLFVPVAGLFYAMAGFKSNIGLIFLVVSFAAVFIGSPIFYHYTESE